MTEGSVRNRTFAIRAGSLVSHTLILFLENLFRNAEPAFSPAPVLASRGTSTSWPPARRWPRRIFELFLDRGRQVPNALQLTLTMRIRRDRDDAIIADLLMLGLLYRLQHANELASQHQTRRGRGVMNDHCVDRIAIPGSGRRDEVPVVGIGQAEHQRLGQNESLELGIECKLRRAPRGVSTTTWTSSCPAQTGSLARFGIAIRTGSRGSAGASLTAQRVLHAANGVADFPADLVGFSFPFEFLVAGCLAGDLLDLALGLLGRTLDAILVHCMSPIGVTGER